MRPLFFTLVALGFLSLAGCAFNRSDFVCGSNGKPRDDEVSDTGKAVGSVIRTGGPSLHLSY